MKVNIIIIGAKQNSIPLNIDNINNYKKWNNTEQADYYDIIDCMKRLSMHNKISVFCLDPLYDFIAEDKEHNIAYINEYFIVGDTKYCTKKGHNIFIEFVNLFDEYYITKDYDEKISQICNYNDYKTTWISCGCCWSNRFPTDLIINIVENHIYTPTDIYEPNSFLTSYNFNTINDNQIYKPYCQGLYQILGSLLWRGSKENQEYETVLYVFIPNIIQAFELPIQEELSRFLQREIRWNALHRKTREAINRTVYGKFITIY